MHHIAQASAIPLHYIERTGNLVTARNTVVYYGDNVGMPVARQESDFVLEPTPLLCRRAFFCQNFQCYLRIIRAHAAKNAPGTSLTYKFVDGVESECGFEDDGLPKPRHTYRMIP